MSDQLIVTEEGAITDIDGAVLYDSITINDLSKRARRRLAEIHMEDENATWEDAEVILKREGLMADLSSGRPTRARRDHPRK